MKKEPSKGWLEFRGKAGARLKTLRASAQAALAKGAGTLAGKTAQKFALDKKTAGRLLGEGLLTRNPLLTAALGISCALAAGSRLKSAVLMGVCTLAVLLCSALMISLTREVFPKAFRHMAQLIIIAAFTAAAVQLATLVCPVETEQLGVYLPLIAVSSLLLVRSASVQSRQDPGYALVDALGAGMGYALALVLLGAVRELLGAGSLWDVKLLGGAVHPALLIAAPCGGFLTLGFLTALAQYLRTRLGRKKEGEAA